MDYKGTSCSHVSAPRLRDGDAWIARFQSLCSPGGTAFRGSMPVQPDAASTYDMLLARRNRACDLQCEMLQIETAEPYTVQHNPKYPKTLYLNTPFDVLREVTPEQQQEPSDVWCTLEGFGFGVEKFRG